VRMSCGDEQTMFVQECKRDLGRAAAARSAAYGEEPYALSDPLLKPLESTKWHLWHGNVFRAFSVSGQLFPEGLLQDLLKPRRNRAAEQRSEEGDIACGVDVLGIHPQLQPETSPV
jgi:hypothetical protein